jgi:hypothetical protein
MSRVCSCSSTRAAGSAPGSSPGWRACFERSDERVGDFRVVLARRVAASRVAGRGLIIQRFGEGRPNAGL